jgi:hypothetical protein
VIFSDRGVMLGDRGVMLGDRGVMLSDRGVMLSDRGVMLSDCGVSFSDRHVSFHGPGETGPPQSSVTPRDLARDIFIDFAVVAAIVSPCGLLRPRGVSAEPVRFRHAA